jgi:hypothetical protein
VRAGQPAPHRCPVPHPGEVPAALAAGARLMLEGLAAAAIVVAVIALAAVLAFWRTQP